MKKSLLFGLFAMMLTLVVGLTGCNVTSSSTTSSPALLTTPEAVISGTAVASGGTVTVRLNSILISGEAITGLTGSKFKVYAGTSSADVTSLSEVSTTVSVPSTSKIDMVFILDNTGSMAGRIRSVKDSIIAFTSSLEAAGVDVNFGVVSFGDDATEQATLELPATATEVKDWLDALPGESGGDAAENPLDSIMVAYNDFTWRSDAQKVFVLITDVYCHQVGDGTSYTSRTVASVESALAGNATVYVVSPKYTYDVSPYGDTRWLADGYGSYDGVDSTSYGVTRPHIGTGGKWIELASSGNIDLTSLGIDTAVTKGYTLTFSYTVSGSVIYIHVMVDTDGDGVYDSDGLITLSISTAGSGKWLPNGELADPALGVKGGSNN